ncbi:hypothetical protein H8356DRAFT_1364486 [Neocallimastix lanati (nom. inval.)]|nr:hypothetical protein H8356DRAFT_1364486 [Neocallimastix sp. JGI-2020a]
MNNYVKNFLLNNHKLAKSIFKKEKILVEKDYKKDSHPLNNVLNTSFGVNQSPTFPFYNSYMKSSSIPVFTLRTRSHFRKDNHRLSSESQRAVISTPDIVHIIGNHTASKSTQYKNTTQGFLFNYHCKHQKRDHLRKGKEFISVIFQFFTGKDTSEKSMGNI